MLCTVKQCLSEFRLCSALAVMPRLGPIQKLPPHTVVIVQESRLGKVMDCNPRGRLAAGLSTASKPIPTQGLCRLYEELARESSQEGQETTSRKLLLQNWPDLGRPASFNHPISMHRTQSLQNATCTFCRILAICWGPVPTPSWPIPGL